MKKKNLIPMGGGGEKAMDKLKMIFFSLSVPSLPGYNMERGGKKGYM